MFSIKGTLIQKLKASISIPLVMKSMELVILSHFISWKNHPANRHPAKFGYILLYSPYLFGKKLFPTQDKLVNNKHTLSQTKLLCHNDTNH